MKDYYRELQEEADLKIIAFFSRVRSGLFNQITRATGGCRQWRYIIGKKRFYNGNPIRIDKRVESILWKVVNYYNTTEGLEELKVLGIEPPEHFDDIIGWIQMSSNSKELDRMIFRYILRRFRKSLI